MQRVKEIYQHMSAPRTSAAMKPNEQALLYTALLEDGIFEVVLMREALEFVTHIALEL